MSSKLIVYPNPNNGSFKVNLGTNYKNVELILTNTLGQVVQQGTYNNMEYFNLQVVDPQGIYLLILKMNDEKFLVRLVKT